MLLQVVGLEADLTMAEDEAEVGGEVVGKGDRF